MARVMGSDTTVDMLKWQFRRLKAGARMQHAFLERGMDPKHAPCDCSPIGKPAVKRKILDDPQRTGCICRFSFCHSTNTETQIRTESSTY